MCQKIVTFWGKTPKAPADKRALSQCAKGKGSLTT